MDWAHPEQALVDLVQSEHEARLASYARIPRDVDEHAAIEARLREGGYRDRQIVEVVQNGVDAARTSADGGRVDVLLTADSLYVANDGAPLGRGGLESLLHSHLSDKRDDAIGRFGLGFKSLLGVSDHIALLSRSVSIEFDEARSRAEIGRVVQLAPTRRVPVTRIAWLASPSRFFEEDPICAAFAPWATTILRAHLTGPVARTRLVAAIEAFPAEFALLVGAGVKLGLAIQHSRQRDFHATPIAGQRFRLTTGDTVTTWRMVARDVHITDAPAMDDAGDLHRREAYTLAWAVPEGIRERGTFWAWFPLLQEGGPLPGVFHAPWKTNDDRSNVLPGAFNQALMREMAALITETLPAFSTPDDPGAPLDYLPRRDVGDRTAAARLADELWRYAREAPIVANGSGRLLQGAGLVQHPEVPAEIVSMWARLAPETVRVAFVHPSTCATRERLGRLRTLLNDTAATPLDKWLEGAATPSSGSCIGVLALVEALDRCKLGRDDRERLRAARIVLSASGRLIAANTACLTDGPELPDGFAAVHPDVLADPASRTVLTDILGVAELSADQWKDALGRGLRPVHDGLGLGFTNWQRLWGLLRRAPRAAAEAFLHERGAKVFVRCADGEWREPTRLLAIGEVVTTEDAVRPANTPWVPDPAFHRDDDWALQALGIAETPSGSTNSSAFGHHAIWSEFANSQAVLYRDALVGGRQPHLGKLGFLDPDSLVAPLNLLVKGSSPVRARLTSWLLNGLSADHGPATFGHLTQTHAYPQNEVPHPLSWLLEYKGLIAVQAQFIALGDLLPFIADAWVSALVTPAVLRSLAVVERGFPADSVPEPENVEDLWPIAFELALGTGFTDRERASLYARAAQYGHLPERLSLAGRVWGIGAIAVTITAEVGVIVRDGEPVLAMPTEACHAFVGAGARLLMATAAPTWTALADPIPLDEHEPLFSRLFSSTAPDDITIIYARDLARNIEGTTQPIAIHRDGTCIVLDVTQVEALEAGRAGAAFEALAATLASAGWLSVPLSEAVSAYAADQAPDLRDDVAAATGLPKRLLRAVGGAAPLRDCLPPEVVAFLDERGASPEQLAEIVLTTHGPSTLRALRSALDAMGLQPPKRWGTARAVAFAESLGFPASFGGGDEARREPVVHVDGPTELKPLHDFQVDAQQELLAILTATSGRRRALLNLPTGAGKTRVTVQTLIEAVRDGGVRSPILWVAQSDELCEQAVSCFREVWSSFGAPRTTLRISRLWGGITRRLDRYTGPHVVVASIQTLVNRFDHEGVEWLADAGVVVIDEAHHAVSPTYSALMRWLARDAREGEPPVIGLTATAFRGFNEDETRRLANRFGGRIVPANRNPEQLLALLQERQVLARVNLLLLDGVDVSLDAEEAAHIDQFSEVPASALERLSRDPDRNRRIVEAILEREPGARILVFALSVTHAHTLAAELTLKGRPAASVDASTATSTRRHLIAGFRDGTIPVLVNYGVLTTGFDAPMTDVIVIARPTFSPNLYQQMVGRGLRGIKNGGKDTCDLVTVEDNFGRYGGRLAFHHFRELFNNTEAPTTESNP